MAKKSTIKDIADQLGVSKALVSFVLNGKAKEKRISDAMAGKVLEMARQMDYTPNYLAKSLKTGKSQTIALIIADISNPFFARFARYLEDEASRHQYKVIIANSDERNEKFKAELELLRTRQVDGFILTPPIGSEPALLDLQEQKVPFVVVDRLFEQVESNTVIIDNYRAAYSATRRLAENGRRHIAILNVNNELVTMQRRVEGYRDALLHHGLAVRDSLVKQLPFSHDKHLVREAIEDIRAAGADALLFTTGKLTLLGLECLKELGIRIPQDISVISFDDMDAYRVTYTPISAIAQPLEAMSREALRILLRQIEQGDRPTEKVMLDVQFIFRESCS